LHDDERVAVRGSSEIEDPNDGGMMDVGRRSSLREKPVRRTALHRIRANQLDRDRRTQRLVVSTPNGTHPSERDGIVQAILLADEVARGGYAIPPSSGDTCTLGGGHRSFVMGNIGAANRRREAMRARDASDFRTIPILRGSAALA